MGESVSAATGKGKPQCSTDCPGRPFGAALRTITRYGPDLCRIHDNSARSGRSAAGGALAVRRPTAPGLHRIERQRTIAFDPISLDEKHVYHDVQIRRGTARERVGPYR